MSIINFLAKELYYKIIYILLLFITIITTIAYNVKAIFLYILSPIKQTKINNFILSYHETKNIFNAEEIENSIYNNIPIIEINLPFFTTSYIYYKYILYYSIYLIVPIILYYIYISIVTISKRKEIYIIKQIILITITYNYINYIITHYIIIPLYLNFIYSHYNEFLFYEFDVEFQIIVYLNFYFKILYANFFFFIILLLKKYLELNINNVVILIIYFFFMPLDTYIQLIYIILFIFNNFIIHIMYNYNLKVKKYKQKEYLETL